MQDYRISKAHYSKDSNSIEISFSITAHNFFFELFIYRNMHIHFVREIIIFLFFGDFNI